MVMHYIFLLFFLIAFVAALIRTIGYFYKDYLAEWGLIFSDADLYAFRDLVQATFNMAEASIGIVIYLIGIMTLWLGILRIAEKGGVINWMSKKIEPFFILLFPEIPKGHEAHGAIVMNFAANMLGLDNAATPFGIKAMEQLHTINPNKDSASNAQIMFLVLNTSGLTLIPISVMALRAAEGASQPTNVFLPILLATYFASLAGLIVVGIKQKINLFHPRILMVLGGLTVFIAGLIYWLTSQTQEFINGFSTVTGNFILMSLIITFLIVGYKKGINLYETFIEGAKEGFSTSIKIIPYLVGILVAIGVFRASGAMDFIIDGIEWIVASLGLSTDFVGALPTAFMKPLSGSGARGMMIETMQNYGPDSFQSFLSGIFQGSTETTFYTIAVYYGAINISKTRYTAVAGLIADFAGILAAIFIGYLFFEG